MSAPCCTPPPQSEYRRFFNRRIAGLDLRRYRRKGLPRTARDLVALAGDVEGATVLEVGGGIGTLALALLDAGAASATNVELSAGYEDAAAALLEERGLAGRVERRVADFVAEADGIPPHDVVVLHRVVCCYPDADALVTAAAARARGALLLTYPRERALTRAGFVAINGWLRFRRCGFRTFVHAPSAIAAAATREGLQPGPRSREGAIWENAVFTRP
ncbi:MAG: SAM-dependent methyltransferase [Actinobacteria bacterium]|nr:SAM-dependent methyltransferase [Actinomycetota bacterium]MBV8563652.1 SAM-dependent methyltransferase [Actinomycetota bacterium]